MRIGKLNVFLLVLLLVTVVGNWTARRDYRQPHFEIMPEMVRTPRFDSFVPNPNFADGKTLRDPVAGTIARGHMPLPYEATPEDAQRAGEELLNPFTLGLIRDQAGGLFSALGSDPLHAVPFLHALATTKEGRRDTAYVQERGVFVYRNYCMVCHDAAGEGKGPVTARGVPSKSLLADSALQMKDGQMFHVITYGQGEMASHASQLTPEDRWLVIMYVRTLQQSPTSEKE